MGCSYRRCRRTKAARQARLSARFDLLSHGGPYATGSHNLKN
jgi:hypothetical protein